MQNQYLIIAENITYKNNKLSCINIMDQLVVISLPSELFFDMAVICGPGWAPDSYDISIKVKNNDSEPSEIGNIKVEVPNENFVYNALAPNLKLTIGEDVKNITFMVYRNDELLIERSYQVNPILVPAPQNA